jgi:hypothetical protein
MSWSGAIAALHADLALAAADVSPAIPLVRAGEPDSLNTDMVAYWMVSGKESDTGGNTLTKVNWQIAVQVTGYIRGSVRAGSIDSTTEARVMALSEAMLVRLWADWGLGGHAIGIAIPDMDYGWIVVGDQLARSVQFTVYIDLAEVATISQ